MKFSVTSSFYNTSPYVEKVYESLLSQTYKNWEWIVTDDFSEESSEYKLKEIEKKRLSCKVYYPKIQARALLEPA